jgi:hypothetical protein
MTEQEWSSSTDPDPILAFLRERASERKLRLFAVACCRRIWHLLPEGPCRTAIEVAEEYAEGLLGEEELSMAEEAAAAVAEAACRASRADTADEGAFVRATACVAALEPAYHFGRRYVLGRYREFCRHGGAYAAAGRSAGRCAYAAHWAAYAAQRDLTAAEAAGLATRAVQADLLRCILGNPFRPPNMEGPWRSRAVVAPAQGIYDDRRFGGLPVLGDALEEAGCLFPEVLNHCRQGRVHARGCWVLDALLGKG